MFFSAACVKIGRGRGSPRGRRTSFGMGRPALAGEEGRGIIASPGVGRPALAGMGVIARAGAWFDVGRTNRVVAFRCGMSSVGDAGSP